MATPRKMRWVDDRWGVIVNTCSTALHRTIVAETLVYSMGVTIAEQQGITWLMAQGQLPPDPMSIAQLSWKIVAFLTCHQQVGQTREEPNSVVGMDVTLCATHGGLLETAEAGDTGDFPAGVVSRLTNKNSQLEMAMTNPAKPWPALTHPRFTHRFVDGRSGKDCQAELIQWMTRIVDNHYEPSACVWTEEWSWTDVSCAPEIVWWLSHPWRVLCAELQALGYTLEFLIATVHKFWCAMSACCRPDAHRNRREHRVRIVAWIFPGLPRFWKWSARRPDDE